MVKNKYDFELPFETNKKEHEVVLFFIGLKLILLVHQEKCITK